MDILELDRIERQTAHLTQAEFQDAVDVRDATACRILSIGEVAKGLDPTLSARHPSIPWPQIAAMRNFLAREYFIRKSAIVWETVKVDISELAAV